MRRKRRWSAQGLPLPLPLHRLPERACRPLAASRAYSPSRLQPLRSAGPCSPGFIQKVLRTVVQNVIRMALFPVMPAFAMTINKSPGQTLDRVGIFLSKSVFEHADQSASRQRDRLPREELRSGRRSDWRVARGKLVLAENCCQQPRNRPPPASSPAPWVLPQRWPNGRWEEQESGTRESPPPAPTASQSATLSPAPCASSRPNRLEAQCMTFVHSGSGGSLSLAGALLQPRSPRGCQSDILTTATEQGEAAATTTTLASSQHSLWLGSAPPTLWHPHSPSERVTCKLPSLRNAHDWAAGGWGAGLGVAYPAIERHGSAATEGGYPAVERHRGWYSCPLRLSTARSVAAEGACRGHPAAPLNGRVARCPQQPPSAAVERRRGLNSRVAPLSGRGPSKVGELGACLLWHQAFQKPPPSWRLLKGLVHQRTGTQLPREKRKRLKWPVLLRPALRKTLVAELGVADCVAAGTSFPPAAVFLWPPALSEFLLGWPIVLAGGALIGGWPEENCCWRITGAGSQLALREDPWGWRKTLVVWPIAWLLAPVFHQHQFSSGHPRSERLPSPTLSLWEALRSAGGQTKTGAGGKLVLAARLRIPPKPFGSVDRAHCHPVKQPTAAAQQSQVPPHCQPPLMVSGSRLGETGNLEAFRKPPARPGTDAELVRHWLRELSVLLAQSATPATLRTPPALLLAQ
ncbi:hypothetical protein QTO34_006444, partial [Cnephaeus nilssonii]